VPHGFAQNLRNAIMKTPNVMNTASHIKTNLREMCDSLSMIVWTSTPDGKSESLNDRGISYTGISRAASETWDWFSLAHPDDEGNARKKWDVALRSSSFFSCQYRLRRFDVAGSP
jgi:PAS domain-containing protein